MIKVYKQRFTIPSQVLVPNLVPGIKVDCFNLAICLAYLYEGNLKMEDLGKIITEEDSFEGTDYSNQLIKYQDSQSSPLDQEKYFRVCLFLRDNNKVILPQQTGGRIASLINGVDIYTRAGWYEENLAEINRENI
jgi:hypothetical protein